MKDLILDGAYWKKNDDIYDAFFNAVGAPRWHGRNFAAVEDSVADGGVNSIDPPYRLIIKNYDLVGTDAKKMAEDFVDLIRQIGDTGVPVKVQIEKSR